MSEFRKKPVVIEARIFTGDNIETLQEWGAPIRRPWSHRSDYRCPHCGDSWGRHAQITTLEDGGATGQFDGQFACPGDYIIRGVKGEFYPCKPDIFAATYDPVEVP